MNMDNNLTDIKPTNDSLVSQIVKYKRNLTLTSKYLFSYCIDGNNSLYTKDETMLQTVQEQIYTLIQNFKENFVKDNKISTKNNTSSRKDPYEYFLSNWSKYIYPKGTSEPPLYTYKLHEIPSDVYIQIIKNMHQEYDKHLEELKSKYDIQYKSKENLNL